MAIQATYVVYDLDDKRTHGKLEASKDVEGFNSDDKRNMSFWLDVDKEKVRVQIFTNGTVNLWHRDENCIGKAVEKLKAFTVNRQGEECRRWELTNMQRIGAAQLAIKLDPLLRQRVKEVLEKFSRDHCFLRWPTVEEVAVEIGQTPENTRSILYELAPDTGWREQEKEQEKKEAEESINLAGWMKWLKRGDEHGEYSPTQIEELNTKAEQEKQQARTEVIERAKMILENYPKLVPRARPSMSSQGSVAYAGLDLWPEETKRVWYRVFQQEAPKSGRDVIQKPILRQAHMLLHCKEEAPKNQEEMSTTQNHFKS